MLDEFEEILLRLDAEDLLRCKSVCKSWYSFISSPYFVKAHLKRVYNNSRELGHLRVCMPFRSGVAELAEALCKKFHEA